MASREETRPLLIRINPKWNRKSRLRPTSIPSLNKNVSPSNIQRTSNNDLVKITSITDRDVSRQWRTKVALVTILVSVVLERLVFYGFVGNLVLFLNLSPLSWKAYSAVYAMFLFYGVSYVMSLVGGWISDSFLGRFKTMILSYAIYMCGYIILPFLANNTNNNNGTVALPTICMASHSHSNVETLFGESCSWQIVLILIIIAIGAGMLKAVISPFGSDQLVHASQQMHLGFFNWFYWCVNIGSFLGLGVIAYVEQRTKFLYGFIACTAGLGFSTIIFIAGFPVYICRPPDGSVLTNIFRIFKEAFRNKREQLKLQQNTMRTSPNSGHLQNVPEEFFHIAGSVKDADQITQSESKIPFLDYAKLHNGGAFSNSLVDDVKKLGMILAVLAVLIPYWLVYFQMQTTFMFQGLNMRLSFASLNVTTHYEPPEIAVAWFTLCDAVFVIILLPLFDRVIYPRMARAGYHFTFAKRIVLGMVFAAVAMIAAGVVEHYRWQSLAPDSNASCIHNYVTQKIGSTTYNASIMSVLWQIPQYALIGFSEVFASVACLQFAVMVAPKSIKAAITGLYYFICGLGSFLGSAIIAILINFNIWYPTKEKNCWLPCDSSSLDHKHKCHIYQVEYYFFLLAGCESLGLLLFFIVARVYDLNIDELTFHARLKNEGVEGRGRENATRNSV